MTTPRKYSAPQFAEDLGLTRLVPPSVYTPAGAIEAQEAAGQRELLGSTVLPISTLERSSDAEFEALGFTFGEPTDELFREATLPEGWARQGSDHSMWSYIVDQLGRRRVAVFYKAAFYDRKAHMHLLDERAYLQECAHSEDDRRPVYDGDPDGWMTRERAVAVCDELVAEARGRRDEDVQRGFNPQYSTEELEMFMRLRARL